MDTRIDTGRQATALVFGAQGWLGQKLLDFLPGAVGSEADIADPDAAGAALDEHRAEVVINCAGKTGRPNVDWCETHRAETLRSNVAGPLVLLDQCCKRRLYLVHLSTGCLYQGDRDGRGFREDDPPNFLGSYYVRTKVHADQLLAEYPVLILRPRMPLDDALHERGLIGKLLRYPRVLDAPNSLTYIPDFLEAARQLIGQRATGVFHVVNPGPISPYEIMQRYCQLVDSSHTFHRMTVDQLHELTAAARSNCVLSIEKLAASGVTMRPCREAVDTALSAIRRQMDG